MITQRELTILSHLRSDARISLAQISRSTKIPISTVFDKIKSLEKKYITKHTSLLNFHQIGHNLKIRFFIKTTHLNDEQFLLFITKNEKINSISKLDSEHSYLLECIFADMKDLSEFSEQLEQFDILEKHEHHIIEEIKHEAFLSDPEHVTLLTNQTKNQ